MTDVNEALVEGAEQHRQELRAEAEAVQYAERQSINHEERQANESIGKPIGPWAVVAKRERRETPSGNSSVYVTEHRRDGYVRGLTRWQVNALLVETSNGGLA